MTILNQPIRFPVSSPAGFQYADDEVVFDPNVHLQLEEPESKLSLFDLGYSEEEVALCPTTFGVSSAARVLSDEGVAVVRDIARSLRGNVVHCERIENMVRGGVYNSRFLREVCLSPEVTEFMAGIFETPVGPHTMPLHLGHINYAPDDLSRAVDKWHHDTLSLDYVMMVNDPKSIVGGEFQYFHGTKAEAKAFSDSGQSIPEDRIVSPYFPGAGYVIVLHGNMVVHRGAKLREKGERITMVNGYVPLDPKVPDVCRFPDLTLVDPHHVLYTEWARHKAWLAKGKLENLMDELPFSNDKQGIVASLKEAVADIQCAIDDIECEDEAGLIHYGD